MTELLSCITATIIAIVALVYIIAGFVSVYKTKKKEAADYQEFIESLKPDSVWVEKEFYRPLNPFEVPNPETVTIIETRYNHYGELWVRYKLHSGTGIRAIKEDSASNFYEVYERGTDEFLQDLIE